MKRINKLNKLITELRRLPCKKHRIIDIYGSTDVRAAIEEKRDEYIKYLQEVKHNYKDGITHNG